MSLHRVRTEARGRGQEAGQHGILDLGGPGELSPTDSLFHVCKLCGQGANSQGLSLILFEMGITFTLVGWVCPK